jgi:xanthine dehydrogenase accessory factor
MTALRSIVDTLGATSDPVVLATVVRVVGSSYGGVGSRMVARVDGSTVGLVSGGCLESDLALHARRVHESGRAEVVSYDTRADDDAVWGLGLGCNGLIDVLLEPLPPARAREVAALLAAALDADAPSVLATVARGDDGGDGTAAVGAHALLLPDGPRTAGDWGSGDALGGLAAHAGEALATGRRGLVREIGALHVAFEVVRPTVRLVVCGTGPDVLPVVRLAAQLGWDVTVVDHRPPEHAHPERLPGARAVSCGDPGRLRDVVPFGRHTAAVVMSHHFARDTEYVGALLGSGAAYVGVLGPRARTERMLAELAARGTTFAAGDRLYGPIGLDLGGDGPEAIALAVVSEVAAVMHGRSAGHLRDRAASLHGAEARATADAPPSA